MEPEKILVVPRDSFLNSLGSLAFQQGFNQAFGHSLDDIVSLIAKDGIFVPRSKEIEENNDYIQIVTYNTLVSRTKVFGYTRSKLVGDERLFLKDSIGVGGHINRNDFPSYERPNANLNNIGYYVKAADREVKEEIHEDFFKQYPKYTITFAGIITNFLSLNQVDRVHFGLVFEFSFEQLPEKAACPSLENLGHFALRELLESEQFNRMETWSQQIAMGMSYPRTTFFDSLQRPCWESGTSD